MELEGDDIVNLVYKQQELYRNERTEERAARAAEAERVERAVEAERVERAVEAERVERAAAAEAERVERAAEAERVERVAEAEREIEREVRAADALERERDKAREHEIRVLELTNSKVYFDQSMADAAMRPKLPVFKDGDDIVSSISRFERIAALLKLTPESYADRMGSLLSGKA